MDYDDKVINSLAFLRAQMAHSTLLPASVREAFDVLDDAGVFRHIDKQTDRPPVPKWEATGEREMTLPTPPADALAILWEEHQDRWRH
jgi:hypothetical protein